LLATGWEDLSPAHCNVQVALVQARKQEPVQMMLQVELPLQVTLPPGATTGVQVELSVQSRVHELRQAPPQCVWFPQEKRQAPASPPQAASVSEQVFPSLQSHVPPVQTGAGAVDEPQAPRTRTRMTDRARMRR
jgi:hypothetical protein